MSDERAWNPMSQQYEPEAPALVEFLLTRIAEDERLAQRAAGRSAGFAWHGDWSSGDVRVRQMVTQFNPARVLAECEAKRRIIEWHKAWPVLVETPPTFDQGDGESYDYERGDVSSMTLRMSQRIAWATEQQYREKFGSEPPTGPVLRLLALPYADHHDFQEGWRS